MIARLTALALAVLPFAASGGAQAADCARPASPVEAAVCGDPVIESLDRLVARALALAGEAGPAGAEALAAEQRRWLESRSALLEDPTDPLPLVQGYEARLRALIGRAGDRALAAALAAAMPIDPLKEAPPEAEEAAAFVAFVLTTRHPTIIESAAPEDEDTLSTYERYAGFTHIAPLPDGRLFAAVPEDCGAYQCLTVPFALDRAAGTAVRLAVEVPDDAGALRRDPQASRLGATTVERGAVTIVELARGSGDCGTRWTYRVEADTLALVKRVVKPTCDGQRWTDRNTRTQTYR